MLEKIIKQPTDQNDLLIWKILRDPLYHFLWNEKANLSFKERSQHLFDCGFFQDRFESNIEAQCVTDTSLFTTPINKINNKPGKKIVLLSTGAFSPIHNGHISMMEAAKERLEKDGFNVVGGYLSPSHDDYVSTKKYGDAKMSASHRVHLCQLAVLNSKWLMVDPWESLYLKTDINFTDVLLRLQSYLNKYFDNIEVWYVCGADNYKFSLVFEKFNGCVVVGREGYNSNIIELDSIKYTQNVSSYANYSSSLARRWNPQLMPENVSKKYFRWKKDLLHVGLKRQHKTYVLRDDWTWAFNDWIKSKIDTSKAEFVKNKFKSGLIKAIKNSFIQVNSPDIPIDIDVIVYDLKDQIEFISNIETNEKLINLDICTNDKKGLNLSRQFALADGQISSNKLIARPGYNEMDEQISMIPAGEYTLIDDDISTGTTINMVLGILPESIRINKIRTLLDFSTRKDEYLEPFDVVDLRDFILGSKDGGLVVSGLNGELMRAPYILPFISLISRASILPSAEKEFSKQILRLNIELFQNLPELSIKDFDCYSRKFLFFLGYTENNSPIQILQDWYNKL